MSLAPRLVVSLASFISLCLSTATTLAQSPVESESDSPCLLQAHVELLGHDDVHWVFVTDCSAYMFNQGNLLLASAQAVQQAGAFTWIVYGCEREDQREAFSMLAHPSAKAWFAPAVKLTDPETGEQFAHFQASNRPVSVQAWFEATAPKESAIAIIDPDMLFLRPVHFSKHPRNNKGASLQAGPWQTLPAAPKRGVGAKYGQGCQSNAWTKEMMKKVCGADTQRCLDASHDEWRCWSSYSSGPPWIMHKSDAKELLQKFPVTTLRVHQVWPNLLSEQVAYGVAQMRTGIQAHIDPFWFISDEDGGGQPWGSVADLDWDPCSQRKPPPPSASNPIFFHACSTFHLHGQEDTGYTLHKDHIHKDLLDCNAPLLRHPPTDSLERHKEKKYTAGFRGTWAVCTYTNLVNAYATAWKQKFCKAPNLEATFEYPAGSQGFLNESSWLKRVFRKGGWTDIDYLHHINEA